MDGFGIIIPCYAQPNFLSTCLYGLVRNSRLKNRIIVVWSDPAHQNEAQSKDYLSDKVGFLHDGKLHAYQKYTSIQDYIARRADFIAENNIEFFDITTECDAFMRDYKAGKVWKGNAIKPADTPWEGGQDIAFKDNWGIEEIAKTHEWVMPNFDCDFYPTPGWDEVLMELALKLPPRSILVPAHMQPLQFDVMPNWPDIWEDSRAIACGRITMPIPQRGGNTTTDEELEEFFNKHKEPTVLRERPGRREYIHHFPVLYRTEELRKVIGPFSYQGSGYDLEWDDRCGQLSFMKYSPRNSWIQHKCYVALRPEDC